MDGQDRNFYNIYNPNWFKPLVAEEYFNEEIVEQSKFEGVLRFFGLAIRWFLPEKYRPHVHEWRTVAPETVLCTECGHNKADSRSRKERHGW